MQTDTQKHNETATPNSKEIEILKKYFPQCFSVKNTVNDGFDIEKFKELIAQNDIEIKKEGFTLNFLGKSYARYQANLDSETVIVPDTENDNESNKDSENVYIVGDNLDALQHLRHSYAEQIKCIYIDPPYNTGKDDFVYNDKFGFTAKELVEKLDITEDEAERIVGMGGKCTHSAWLTFMYPRLSIARELLRDDGVIFISIDDNEQANLKRLCDEVFGEGNFVAQLIWAAGKKNDSKFVSVSHEYILIYVKNKDFLIEKELFWKERKQGIDEIYKQFEKIKSEYPNDYEQQQEALRNWYKTLPKNSPILNQKHYRCVDEKGIYFPSDISWPGGGGPKYDVYHPITKKKVPVPTRGWVFPSQERMQQLINEGKIHFGKDETFVPCIKTYLKENEFEAPYSVIYRDGRGASKRIKTLFNNFQVFNNPKDEEILEQLFSFLPANSSGNSNGDIILDFFSGSGTTAHAVMDLNASDNGNRKFIMVQLNESVRKDSEAQKAGYDTIDEVGRERIRRAAAKLKTEHPDTKADLGFKTYYLKPMAQNTIDKIKTFDPNALISSDADIIQTLGENALLQTWQIKDGLGFYAKAQKIDLLGYTAYLLDSEKIGKYLYLLDGMEDKSIKELIRKIESIELTVDKIFVYGYSFDFNALNTLKTNLKTLKNRNPIEPIVRY